MTIGYSGILAGQAQTAYNNDLLVGFTTGTGTDTIYDLGRQASLVNGQTWNLATVLSAYNVTNVQWGVIGSIPVSTTTSSKLVFATAGVSGTPPSLTSGLNQFNGINGTTLTSIYQFMPAQGAGNYFTNSATGDPQSWFNWTSVNGLLDGSSFIGAYHGYDVNVTGLVATGFYKAAADKSATVQLGTFTLNSSKILTYNVLTAGSSTNAYLTSLVLSPVLAFSPTFTSNTLTGYTATVTNGSTPTVTVVNADTTATNRLIFNNTTNLLTSATPSSSLTPLTLGVTNVVKVQVSAQDGLTVYTYQVNILVQPSLTQPKLTNSVSGNILSLSWPSDHLGYRLLTQTNNLSKGVSSNTNDWGTVAGSTSITATNLTILPAGPGGYYRLVYP